MNRALILLTRALGFRLAVLYAAYTFSKYSKLSEMQSAWNEELL